MTNLPPDVEHGLRVASQRAKRATKQFRCTAFRSTEWNAFTESWAPVIYGFLIDALGPMGREPAPTLLPLEAGHHMAWATACFAPWDGQICLSDSIEGKPGQTLEKLTHEMVHASLAQFPEGDPFYEEGFVDYSVWVMAHAPVWGEHREAMIHAAAYNIAQRRERAMKQLSDWDVKRWAGGLYASVAHGPFIIARLKMRKAEGKLVW
jgi:hypothetical protein